MIFSGSDSVRVKTMCKPAKYPGFTGVDVSGGIDLYLSNGPESVSITSTTEVRDHIVTEVVHGVLQNTSGERLESRWDNGKMKAYVSIDKIKSWKQPEAETFS